MNFKITTEEFRTDGLDMRTLILIHAYVEFKQEKEFYLIMRHYEELSEYYQGRGSGQIYYTIKEFVLDEL